MDIPKALDKIERHQRKEGETQAEYAKRVFNVRRQTLDTWRKGKEPSANAKHRIEALADQARRWQADHGRTDDDHRRRAMAAVNLLEGRALKLIADVGVSLSAAQEVGGRRQQGAETSLAGLEQVLRLLQSQAQTPDLAG